MAYNGPVVKNGIFCIAILLLVIMIPLFLIVILNDTQQNEEISNLKKEIENQNMLIEYLKGSDKE